MQSSPRRGHVCFNGTCIFARCHTTACVMVAAPGNVSTMTDTAVSCILGYQRFEGFTAGLNMCSTRNNSTECTFTHGLEHD